MSIIRVLEARNINHEIRNKFKILNSKFNTRNKTKMRNSERGDTIIEVMFAMAIIGVVLAAAYATASKNLQVSQLSKERSQASAIAEAQLEQLKALKDAPSIDSFCLDIEADPAVIASGDPACVDGFFTKTITKDNSQYKIVVEWLPPGGVDTNLANVTMVYSDYDFALSGSGNLSIATLASGAGGVTLSASIRNETSILSSGIVFSLGANPRVGDGTSTVLLSSPTSADFQRTVSSATFPAFDPNVIYYARSFATTPNGIVYSSAIRFSGTIVLTPPATAPIINSLDSSSPPPTASVATITGVVDPSGSSITRRELRYYPTSTPASARVVNPNSNNFTQTLTQLLPGVSYTYELTVENSIGVTSSGLRTFTTATVDPTNFTFLGTNNGSSYYLSTGAYTWTQADQLARNAGGHLVTIESAAENSYVSSRTSLLSWIGLTDSVTEGVWRWVTNEPFNYTNWSPTEPNNNPAGGAGGEDYAVINWSAQPTRWNDLGDSYLTTNFIVEFDSRTPPTSKLGSGYAACVAGAWGCPTVASTGSVYDCGNYNVRYAFSPLPSAQYNAVVINYGDAFDYCTPGGTNPPAALYNYQINVYINGVLNVSNFNLVPTIGRAASYRTIPITPPSGPITSVNIEWINNQWVPSNANPLYDPDFQINNVSLGYQ